MNDRWQRWLAEYAVDIGIGVLLAALVIAVVLFGGAVSQFVYIDF